MRLNVNVKYIYLNVKNYILVVLSIIGLMLFNSSQKSNGLEYFLFV